MYLSWVVIASPKTSKQRALGRRQVWVQNQVFILSDPHLRLKENLLYDIDWDGTCTDYAV